VRCLRREVVVDRLLGDLGGGRHLGHGDGLEAVLREQSARRGRDGLAGGTALALAESFGLHPVSILEVLVPI
jgi:hypothetical protein